MSRADLLLDVVSRIRNLEPPYTGAYDLDRPDYDKGWRSACRLSAKILEIELERLK